MRNGRISLRRLQHEMMGRFDRMERAMLVFRRELRAAKINIKALFDTVAELDDDLQKHKRNRRAHENHVRRP